MKLHTTSLLAATALCAAMTAGAAHAGVIFPDDFESNTIGSAPAGWTLHASPTTFTVESDSQSPIGNVGDDQGMHLDNDPNVTFERMEHSFTAQTGTFYLQFDYRGFNAAELHNVQLGDGSFTNGTPGRGPGLTMSNWPGVTVNTWYRFTLTVDVAADTYDLRLQSLADASLDTTTTGIAFNNAQAEIDSIRFWFNTGQNGSGEYALDNILISDDAGDLNFTVIPEPAALPAGLLLATIAAGRRRRRVTA